MIDFILEDILYFHEQLSEGEVMAKGVRSYSLLESAVYAPFQTFQGYELYDTIYLKAAQLCYGLAKNHPFIDGNKRTALHGMIVLLAVNGIDLAYTDREIEELIIAVADGRMLPEELANWLMAHEVTT